MSQSINSIEQRFRALAAVSPLRILLGLLVLTLVGTALVLWFINTRSEQLFTARSLQDASSVVEQAVRGHESDAEIASAWANHGVTLKRIDGNAAALLLTSTNDKLASDDVAAITAQRARQFEQRAARELLNKTQGSLYEVRPGAASMHLRYAAPDGHGGLLIVEKVEAPELQNFMWRVTRALLLLGFGASLAIFGMGWLLSRIETIVHDAASLSTFRKQELWVEGLARRDRFRGRNRLALIVLLAGIVFGLDLRFPFLSFGVAYSAVVVLSLTSSRRWHTHLAAIASTLLVFAKLFITAPRFYMWIPVANALLALFAIWSTALLSLSNLARARADATTRAQAAARQQESTALQAALDRLNLATRAAGIGVWDHDFIQDTINGDPQFWQIMQAENSVRTSGGLEHLIHPADVERVKHTIDTVIDERVHDTLSVRHRVQCADGAIRHVQHHAKIFRNADGTLARTLGVVWDVTEEIERAERERHLVDRLSVATKAAGISAWEFDAETKAFVWDTNRPAAFNLDHVPIENMASELNQLIAPEDRGLFEVGAREAWAHNESQYSFRFRIARANNPVRHMQSFVRLIKGADGRHRMLGATWDVTNEVQTTEMMQRQAQAERELSDRLSIATQAAGISSWDLDITNRIFTQQERGAADALETLKNENLLEEMTARQHPDDRENFNIAAQAAMATKEPRISYRYRLSDGQGEWRHIQNYAHLFFDDCGTPIRALGVSWEITEQIKAAQVLEQQTEQLRDAERRMHRASRSSSEGHWEWDIKSGDAWHSESFYALLGYKSGDLPRKTSDAVTFLRHPDDIAGATPLVEHLASGQPYQVEWRFRMANGDYRWFNLRGMAEFDEQGQPTRVAGSIQDIHQQKLAEDALRLAQRRFERAIHGTQDGLWEVEVDRSGAWFSPRFGALLGFTSDELGPNVDLLSTCIHRDDLKRVTDASDAHFNQGVPFDVELRMHTKEGLVDGTYRWYRARAVAERDAEGKPLRLSGSLQDITEARQARDELVRATEAANAANQAKSAFLANVSHEIRTPMNGILGMTSLLIETELDRSQRDYAETIRASGDSLLAVINDILDFSKIEAGKLDIEHIDMDLRANVDDVGSMMAFQASSKKLELVINVQPNVPHHVRGDPQRIRQCLINLIGNAIKFTSSGEIFLEVSVIDDSRADRVMTRFEVRDTGIGITPQTLEKLFQPFTQADSSTTRHFGGTGLGLSIVRRLVEMMGGEVGARSELNKGSAFWFTLPFEVRASTQQLFNVAASAASHRLLIVDDNHTNRRVLLGQLEHAGYQVDAAANGADALVLMRQAYAERRPIDLVLVDFQMPDMDGLMLGNRIHADAQLSSSRLVMLTSMDRHGDIRQFAALGFAGYLAKPVRGRELFDCIDQVLARKAEDWRTQALPMITRNALTEQATAQRYSGRILLVEDNAVNQKVALKFLQRLGCEVMVADNGAEGVAAYEQSVRENLNFDLVLMDLQMPVMDGFTATRRIRDFEGWRKRIPLVALTANAMSGQMERCIAAGMDGFLTKPLEIARLREVLDKFGLNVNARTQNQTTDPSPMPPSTDAPALDPATLNASDAPPPVDLGRLDELTGGDVEFAHDLITTFIASSEQIAIELRDACSANDRVQISRAIHKLKGASANIHAIALAALCGKIESRAATLNHAEMDALLNSLETELQRAIDYLQATRAPVIGAQASGL